MAANKKEFIKNWLELLAKTEDEKPVEHEKQKLKEKNYEKR